VSLRRLDGTVNVVKLFIHSNAAGVLDKGASHIHPCVDMATGQKFRGGSARLCATYLLADRINECSLERLVGHEANAVTGRFCTPGLLLFSGRDVDLHGILTHDLH
jgi:hypothetical protein